MRHILGRCVYLAALLLVPVAGQAYPDRPITWIVPFSAGGPTDGLSRLLAERVGQVLGQSIVIENVGGAGGTLGARRAARMPADGYAFFVGHIGTMAAAPYLYRQLPYDPLGDFQPVFRFPDTPMALLVGADSSYQSAEALIEAARARPRTLTIATAGVGSSSHLAAAYFAATAKAEFTFVPYKGTGPAMNDLIGGSVDALFDQTNVALPQVQGGRLRALALTAPQRMALFPGVPTLAEGALPGFQASTWYGLYAPAGVSADVVGIMDKAYRQALADEQFTERLKGLGIDVLPESAVGARELADYTASEQRKWERVIRESGMPVN